MKKYVIIIGLVTFCPHLFYAQWIGDTTANNPILTGFDEQLFPKIISDQQGGGIIVWEDYRVDGDVYVQRINSNGNLLWNSIGIPVCTASGGQNQIQIIQDGNGGAIIVWVDRRVSSFNTDIYVQRIDASGNMLWTSNGVAVCTASGNQLNPQLISDGTGGAIIVWGDNRNSSTNSSDIYAQRVSAGGTIIWQANGIPLCNLIQSQVSPMLAYVDDDTAGAIIVWEDNRNTSNQEDLYAQRISLDGNILWAPNGISLVSALAQQRFFKLVTTDDGKYAIAWEDYRSSQNERDIWVQKFDKYGTKNWDDGKNITNRLGTQFEMNLSSDGSNNLIIVYRNQRYANWISAQKLDQLGNKVWADTGVVIGKMSTSHFLLDDGSGNAIILFEDGRNTLNDDVYASKLDASGNYLWGSYGAAISTVENNQGYISAIVDGSGGAIVVWEDDRSDTSDIYASRIFNNGSITSLKNEEYQYPEGFYLMQNYPNPFNPSTVIRYQLPAFSKVSLKVYDVLGNEVSTIVNEELPAGNYEVKFVATELSTGIYFYELQAGNLVESKKMILLK